MIEEVEKIDLDEIDRRILEILQISGRDSASSIAEAVNLSVPAASERIKKLQDLDVIRGYEAVINAKKVGLDVSALVTVITESSSNYEKVIDCVNNTPEIVECYATTGGGSHILLTQTTNTETLEKLLRKIQGWPGIIRTETQIILSSNKRKQPLRIPLKGE